MGGWNFSLDFCIDTLKDDGEACSSVTWILCTACFCILALELPLTSRGSNDSNRICSCNTAYVGPTQCFLGFADALARRENTEESYLEWRRICKVAIESQNLVAMEYRRLLGVWGSVRHWDQIA